MLDIFADTVAALIRDGNSYLFLLPIYSVLLVGERVAHALVARDRIWNNPDAAANIAITVATLGLNTLVGHLLPLGVMAVLYQAGHLFTLGDGLGGWALAFVLYDLAWYIDHRLAHRVGFFWAMHHVHHSSPEYNMTVASRGFIIDTTLLSRPMFYLLPLVGITPFHYIVINIATNIWGIAQHTRLVGKLGWLDRLFATPSNHRVHHGFNDLYIDRNYGEVLMLWDRLFGTYQAEQEEPNYGVTDPIDTDNPLRIEIAGFGWLRAKMLRAGTRADRLRCLIMPPEWSPPSAPTPEGVMAEAALPS